MDLLTAVVAAFVAAAIVPILYPLLRQATGWFLGLATLGLFGYFARFLGSLPPGGITASREWIPSLGFRFSFLLDGLSLLFALLITGIGALILIYAGGYLGGHKGLGRLYVLLLVFMGSMVGLVLADNLFTMFVFWELTSVSSYLLIGFDHERAEARAAALKALLVTGGGGLAMMAGVLLLGQMGIEAGLAPEVCFEVSQLNTVGPAIKENAFYLPILLLILAGAFTKSAQFPFHFWLPAAMEAPTPISAYLHSATMVKAGVYLLARLSPILAGTVEWLWIVSSVGAITMFWGAFISVRKTDLKQILAYSTVSALGLLMLLLGLGSPAAIAAAVTFVLVHALYKGALFMVAGIIDHEVGTRNIQRLGGLARVMPVTAVAAGLAAASMAAVPPLFGFIGKELFYESTLHGPARVLVTTVAFLTSMLFVAIAIMTGVRPFLGAMTDDTRRAHNAPMSLWLGPATLAGLSLVLGLAPFLLDQPLLAIAHQNVLGDVIDAEHFESLHLALWHGWNFTLALSGFTLVAGCVVYLQRDIFRALPPHFGRWTTDGFYDMVLAGMNSVAKVQTSVLQSGYLRYYLLMIYLTATGLVGYTAATRTNLTLKWDWSDIRFYEWGLCVLIMLGSLFSAYSRSRLTSIAGLGVVGYCVALLFVFYGAPDLAMTQILIETLSVILFVFVFYHLPPSKKLSGPFTRLRDIVVAIAIGGIATILVLQAEQVKYFTPISQFFVENSVPKAHGRNIVNVILVDFRGLDTMGEITVLAVAAVGVYALLKLRPQGGKA